MRIREVRSPFSGRHNTVLDFKALQKHFTVFGQQWTTMRDGSPSISVQGLDITHDIHAYNPGLPVPKGIQTSDGEEEDEA